MSRIDEVAARKAEILSAVPAEVHAAIKAEAWYVQGRIGGLYTDALHQAIGNYRNGNMCDTAKGLLQRNI